jgi:hypothetical protein
MFDLLWTISGPIIVGIIYAGCSAISIGAYLALFPAKRFSTGTEYIPALLAGVVLAFAVNKTAGEDIKVTAKAFILSELGAPEIVSEGVFKEANITLNDKQMKEFKDGIYHSYIERGIEGSKQFTYNFMRQLMDEKVDKGSGNFSNKSSAVALFNAYNNAIRYFLETDKLTQCEIWLSGDSRNISNELPSDIAKDLAVSLGNFLESRSAKQYDFNANIEEVVAISMEALTKSENQNSKCILFSELISLIDEGTDVDRATFINAVLFQG